MATNPFILPTQSDYGQIPPYAVYGYNGWGGFSPYSGGVQNASQDWGTAIGAGGQYVNPQSSMEDIFAANRNQISATGNVIGQEAGSQLNYYGPLQQQYTAAENAALNQLQQTPGYTPDEASQINVNYGQFNTSPEQWQGINNTVNTGVQNEGRTLNAYQSGLGDQLSQYSSNLGGATTGMENRINNSLGLNSAAVNSGVSGLQSGLQSAQGKFGNLDTAVNDPGLGFDPNQTEKQMTDQDVSNLVTSAGTTVGNAFQAQKDDIERRAAAQGNTSPEALAAMERDLTTQGAATAGDAMTNARIAALQAQYQRAAGIEQQREGAVQTQQGMRATAATTEEAAAQAAAGQAGQANIGAQQFLSQQGLSGAEMAGQAGVNAANTMGQANLGALSSYYPLAVNQQNTMTGQQYGAQVNQANTQYAQGTGSQQMTAAGASNVGQARQAGQAAYRSGVAGQQGMAQQGGQAAMQAQLGAYGTQTSGVTGNASAQGSFEVGKPSLGDSAGKALTGLFAEGGIADHPQIAKLGEKGPELIVPLAGYKSSRYRSDEMNEKKFGKVA